MKNSKKISIIGAPYMFGKDNPQLGSAPNIIRKAGLYKAFAIAGFPYKDSGDIKLSKGIPKQSLSKTNLKYPKEVIEIAKTLSKKVGKVLEAKETSILLGGDHSISIGALLGVAALRKNVSLVYIDTHGDFHTSKTTPSGRLHGMALAVSVGLDEHFSKLYGSPITYFDKNKSILFGAQKFDPGEREAIVKNISLIDMPYIVRHGIGNAVNSLLNQIQTKDIYISLDLDAIDKEFAPGTDMAIYGALSYREILYALENLAEKHAVIGMDVVEMSPDKDVEGKTASIAIECITTALGKRIGTYELYMDKLEHATGSNTKHFTNG